jgi:hypothetical protein
MGARNYSLRGTVTRGCNDSGRVPAIPKHSRNGSGRFALKALSIIYAELLAGTYQGALHHADMHFSSRYNTYKYAGLPPGPIANPGKSSLEAAMHPAQSDYYYFVADAQGHHRFARTIEEHNKNVAACRRPCADSMTSPIGHLAEIRRPQLQSHPPRSDFTGLIRRHASWNAVWDNEWYG